MRLKLSFSRQLPALLVSLCVCASWAQAPAWPTKPVSEPRLHLRTRAAAAAPPDWH